jgi:hypothetical protein
MNSAPAGESILTVNGPGIGFLFLRPDAEALLKEDQAALSPLFKSSQTGAKIEWPCTVLLIYATLDLDGKIVETGQYLRDVVRQSGAFIAVVATETSTEILSGGNWKPRGVWAANIVLTGARHGGAFPLFFHRLFSLMYGGRSFAVSWNHLAPQFAGAEHGDAPGTLCLVEAGGITFRTAAVERKGIAVEAMDYLGWSFQKDGKTHGEAAEVAINHVTTQLDGKPFHLETALSRLGVLAGHGCQFAASEGVRSGRIKLRPDGEAMYMEVGAKDGHKYYLGGLLNEFLGEARLSLWGIISTAISSTGSPLPDITQLIKHSTETIGSAQFGFSMVEIAHQPRELALNSLKRDFGPCTRAVLGVMAKNTKYDPLYLGWIFGLAGRELILRNKDILSPTLAGKIFMEAALTGAKIAPERLQAKPSSSPPAPAPNPTAGPTTKTLTFSDSQPSIQSTNAVSANNIVLRAVIFCQAVVRDSNTGEQTLREKFESLESASFPFTTPPFTVRVIMDNFPHPPRESVFINFKHPRTGVVVESLPCRPAPHPAGKPLPPQKLVRSTNDRKVDGMTFPEPGKYEIEVRLGNLLIGTSHILVKSKSGLSFLKGFLGKK